jgi:hypothetical protein
MLEPDIDLTCSLDYIMAAKTAVPRLLVVGGNGFLGESTASRYTK